MVQGSVLSLVCGDEGDSSARFITEHVLVFRWLLTSSSVKPVFTVPIRSLNARSSSKTFPQCANAYLYDDRSVRFIDATSSGSGKIMYGERDKNKSNLMQRQSLVDFQRHKQWEADAADIFCVCFILRLLPHDCKISPPCFICALCCCR